MSSRLEEEKFNLETKNKILTAENETNQTENQRLRDELAEQGQ